MGYPIIENQYYENCLGQWNYYFKIHFCSELVSF